jgi:Ca2+-binding RTX toxin-like protein
MLNLSLVPTSPSGATITPSTLGINSFVGTENTTGWTGEVFTGAGEFEYVQQIEIPTTYLPFSSSYDVFVGGSLNSSPSQDFSIFFTSNPVVGQGHGWGDVHLVNFDGTPYDFQAVGEFILVKSLIDDFQVQTRQQPWYSGAQVSVNTAFATTIDGYNIVFDTKLPVGQQLKIDGSTYNLLNGQSVFLGNSKIERTQATDPYGGFVDAYTLTYAGPDGIIATSDDDKVTAYDHTGSYINIFVDPADYRFGVLQGLLGNGDGVSTNDFALRNGTDLGSNPSVQTIHTTYADSWRITQEESLFGTPTFADKSFPTNYVSLPTLAKQNPQGVANAFAKGREFGIAEGAFLNGGVFDFVVTGDEGFLKGAKLAANFALQNGDTKIPLGSIKGSKWNDANGNGLWDTGEKALAGWTIYIDSVNNGQLDPWELSTVTNADGQYTFSNLGPGEYAIREVNQTGWQQTASPSPVILGAGQTLSNVNFGNVFLPTVTLAVSPNSVTEDGPTNLGYIFTRAGSTINALTVNYGIAGTANATDYTGATPGTGKTITFAAGSATATLTLDPTADTTIENNETVALTLATGTGYTVGTTTAVTGTITNDDLPSINLSPSSQTVVEGLTSPQNLSYTVSLSGSSPQTITVQYSTANGTALAGSDYTATTGTLTFTPGVTSQTISIPILNDSVNEANETFTLKLTSPTNAILGGTATVTTTITDTLSASTTTTLPANVENLTLTGSSVINGTGNAGNNILTGNTANNTLNGGAGNDTLNGGAGNDTLIGGAGKDTLTGGTGTDKFVFTSLADSLLAGYDVISDYTIGEQIDAPSSIVSPTTLNASIGNIGSLSAANIGALPLVANTARAFTVTGQSGTFLVFNDSLNAFNAATDSIVQLSGYSISATNTVTIV